ncbi:MAG TPA: dual specificity protein phosphatase family protein [Pyrinomonadaceae bacterium]
MKRINFRYVTLIVAMVGLALANASTSARMSKVGGVTIENFGKVDGHYYRGSQPHQEEVPQLKELGIKTVIDLREDYKKDEEDWVRGLGMQYFRIPLRTSKAATDEQANYFLSLVNDSANWPVYVHCKGGRHRTGAMTAIYRITHDGWTADQAFAEMKEYEFEHGFLGGPSAQKKFVYAFYQTHQTAALTVQK